LLSNPLVTIVERSEAGPYVKEKDFDLTLARRVQELVQAHGIRFDPEVVVPADDEMADRLYQAAVELIVEIGVYNLSTERRILFSREEIEHEVAMAPSEIVLGAGSDAVVVRHRKVEDDTPCVMIGGPTGTPTTEHYHPLILQSVAQEPLVNGLGGGSVASYLGRLIIPSSPTEILAARRDATVAREAVRMAGRAGMHIHDVASPLTCAGKMATIDPATALRPSDAFLVSQIPELKTNYDQLSRVAHMQNAGIHIVDLMTPLIGGLGGGAEGTALVTVASHILGVLCYRATHHYMGHMSLRWSHNTDRMGLWIQAVSGQALARNTPLLSFNDLYARSGLGTAALLWEVAAGAVIGTVCGLHQHGVGCTCGNEIDQTSGLEERFQAEVAHASLGLRRDDANALVLSFLNRYEEQLADPDLGSPFSEVYDEETLEPREGWAQIYDEVREALRIEGLDLDEGRRKVRHVRHR
jgi:methylamine--corrinoid protein Co-methyltransferase